MLFPNLNTLSAVKSNGLLETCSSGPPPPPHLSHHGSCFASQAKICSAALLCICSVQTHLALSAKQGLKREQLLLFLSQADLTASLFHGNSVKTCLFFAALAARTSCGYLKR